MYHKSLSWPCIYWLTWKGLQRWTSKQDSSNEKKHVGYVCMHTLSILFSESRQLSSAINAYVGNNDYMQTNKSHTPLLILKISSRSHSSRKLIHWHLAKRYCSNTDETSDIHYLAFQAHLYIYNFQRGKKQKCSIFACVLAAATSW